MLIIDALFWPFLSRQLDKNADEFIEETDWEQVQLQVSAETMGSFRRKRFTPYLGWWALYLFDVCHGWSVAYLKCFFFPFFRLYSVVWRIVQYVSCRLHPRDSTKRRTNLVPLFCCRVHMCSMPRAWMHLKNSHSTENQCVPCADHIITRNCCSGWKFFLFLYNSDNTIFSTDQDCRECKPVCLDREIMLSSIWTRNIACYFIFTYLVDGRRNLPTLLGFWIIDPSSPSKWWLYHLTFVGQNFI